jgi:prevent-host-death family protein
MRRYKPYGRLLELERVPRIVEEVSMRELRHDTSGVLKRVKEGRRAIVTRRGTPVAVILEIDEAVGLCGTVILTRQEAERRMFGEELDEHLRERRSRKLLRPPDRRRERGPGDGR